jgi:hypothetical protein
MGKKDIFNKVHKLVKGKDLELIEFIYFMCVGSVLGML